MNHVNLIYFALKISFAEIWFYHPIGLSFILIANQYDPYQ